MNKYEEDSIDEVINELVDDEDLAKKLKRALHPDNPHTKGKRPGWKQPVEEPDNEDLWDNVPV